MDKNMKTISYASPTRQVTQLAKDLRKEGYEVEKDSERLVAKLDGVVVVRALKMRSTWAIRANPEVIKVDRDPIDDL